MRYYQRLQDLLATQSGLLPLSALAIVDARDPLVYAIGPGIKVGDAGKHQFSRGTINGRYFESAYIYRPSA